MLENRLEQVEGKLERLDRDFSNFRELIQDLGAITARIAESLNRTQDRIVESMLRTDRLEAAVAENTRQIADNARQIADLKMEVAEIGHKLDGLIDIVDGMIPKRL